MSRFILFIKFRKLSIIIYSDIFSVPFFSPVFLVLDGVPQVSEALFIFIHSFFFLYLILGNLNSRPSQNLSSSYLILYSASSDILLSACHDFFISIIASFNSRISIWLLSIISLPLLIFFGETSFSFFLLIL